MSGNDLEERLIRFSVQIIKEAKKIEKGAIEDYLANQVSRSAISASLNFGESRGAESKRDFVHKLKICLKELHETSVTLRIINEAVLTKGNSQSDSYNECRELIAILSKSIVTAKKNSRIKAES